MGLLDNNSFSIFTKDGGFSAAQTFAMDDTGVLVEIDDVSRYRNKWLCVDMAFSGIAHNSVFRIQADRTIFYADDGRIFHSLVSGRDVWNKTREAFAITLLFPLSGCRTNLFRLRNNAASTAGSSVSYSYAFVDPIPLGKPIQYLGRDILTPTGAGDISNSIQNGNTLVCADFRWFKYFFVKILPVKADGSVQGGVNYDYSIQRMGYAELTSSAYSQSETLVVGATTPFTSEYLPVATDRGWRNTIKVNTHIADTRYIIEFYGVR